MKKQWITLLTVASLSASFPLSVFASDTIWFKDVVANANAATQQAAVTGKLASGAGQLVTLKVVDPNGQYFLDSVKSGADGTFSFQWKLAATGKYQVRIGAENNPEPYQTEFTLAPPGPGSAGIGGGGGGIASSAIQYVGSDQLVAKQGQPDASVRIEAGKTEVRLPVQALSSLIQSSAGVVLENDQFSVQLSSATLRQFVDAAKEKGLQGAEVALRFAEVSQQDRGNLLAAAEKRNAVSLQAISPLFEFTMELLGASGGSVKVSTFAEPVTLKLTLQEKGAQALKLSGIYYVSDDGDLAYIGGTREGNVLSGKTGHFSAYAALAYTKSFKDVPAEHWARDVITEMAAKHIVEGVSLTEFDPQRSVTRAEFTTLLARALELPAGHAAFDDVPADAWYASAVAAAYAAGVVQGSSDTEFAPAKTITREEMATMLVRAWSWHHPAGAAQQEGPESFADQAAISDWAAAFVSQARGLGLMQGRGENEFAPQGVTVRAEAAQAVYNLLAAK